MAQKFWEKYNPFKRKGKKNGKIDDGEVLKMLNEYRGQALAYKADIYTEYDEIDDYYGCKSEDIFADWIKDKNWEDWMSAIHEPKVAESLDAIMANFVPAFPRPQVAAMDTEWFQTAQAGDALLSSVLFLGRYKRALIQTATNMSWYNTGFMMPTIDRLKFFPDKRIVIEADSPRNVLMNPGARDVEEAAWLIVSRQLHKSVVKGLYPEREDEIENLAGTNPLEERAGTKEGATTLGYAGWTGTNFDTRDNVSLEMMWQLDYSLIKVKEKEDLDKARSENDQYYRFSQGEMRQPPEDDFEVYDLHEQHIRSHQIVVDQMQMTSVGIAENPAFQMMQQHQAQHLAAIGRGITGGEFYKYPYGKRFSLVIGGKVVQYDDICPYSEFGIRDFPIVDFQMILPPKRQYWDVGISRRIINLAKKRDRLSNSMTDNVMLAGHPMFVKMKGGPENPDREMGRLGDVVIEDAATAGGHRFISPPAMTSDGLNLTNDADRQIERATGLYATMKGESVPRMSGRAVQALNAQGSKIIDVKLDVQKPKIARLGDMVLKMALKLYGAEEKAIVAGEFGGVHVQNIDMEALRKLEYKVVAVSGDSDSMPFDQKMEGYMAMMQQIMPMFMSVPGGLGIAMEIAIDFAKGVTPEFEKYEPQLLQLVEMAKQLPPMAMAGAEEQGSSTTSSGGQ